MPRLFLCEVNMIGQRGENPTSITQSIRQSRPTQPVLALFSLPGPWQTPFRVGFRIVSDFWL